MPRINVQFAALEGGAQTLDATYGQLQELISQLESAVRPLATEWKGDAQAGYASCQQMWRSAADDLGILVQAVKDGVIEANELAQQREAANRALFP